MPRIRISRRRSAGAVAICVFLSSCLEPVEPTPTSAVVSIVPVSPFTRGFETETITRFEINIRVQNNGTRTIHLDGTSYRLEKLVDQKWVVARETPSASFQATRTIGQSQRVTSSYVMLYNSATAPQDMLLSHIRGLYRLRLRLAFDTGGADPLPEQDSYSQPFAVAE